MRCLYCGKELALLKRLTGGGDFCSDAHKQSYQEEYNRLALSRLLQAQKKGQQTNNSPAQNAPPSPPASVALEEPAHYDAARGAAAPVLEVALTETLTQAIPEEADAVAVEESAAEEVVEVEPAVSAEPEPLEAAGFLLESPAFALLPEEAPYLESWLELSSGPAMSEWQPQNGTSFTLAGADLLALNLRPNASSIEEATFPEGLSPQALTGAQPDPALSSAATAQKRANTNRLPAGGAIAIDIAPCSVASDPDGSLVQSIAFESTVLVDDSEFFELTPTDIDFPAEDSAVLVLARTNSSASAPTQTEAEPEAAAAEDPSPRASLEALSRLHQELVEQEAAAAEAPVESVDAEPVVEAGDAEAVEVIGLPETAAEEPDPAEEAPKAKFTTELFEISVKTFPPAKPAVIGGDPVPGQTAPLLPHLKSLPLRPKVALASGYVPPSAAPAPSETKPATPAPTVVRAPVPSKPSSTGKPPTRLTQPKQPTPSAKTAQSAAAKVPETRTPAPPKAVSPKAEETKPVAKPVVSQPAPVQEVSVTKAIIPDVAPQPSSEERTFEANTEAPAPHTEKPAANAEKPAADTPKPTADTPKLTADQSKPTADQSKPTADPAKLTAEQAKTDDVPSFGVAQPSNMSWLGSLKVKLGIAIVLLVIACVSFLGWGGRKSIRQASANPAVASDGSGPSIIMGEGGWVEDWAGDPQGLHAGRQITIYRPSLKLSDYRLEFQGNIDLKSVGWVFRAADPDNYYAMKLMTVSSGLSPKVALFKYLVAGGKQTQVGRVPIDLTVQSDTVFAIRVDVRGPQFTT
jgi:hypothetical protein